MEIIERRVALHEDGSRVAFATDVTERTENEVREDNRRLEELAVLKADFTACATASSRSAELGAGSLLYTALGGASFRPNQ